MNSKETNKANYQFYKSHGICVQCGNYKAAPGRVRCEVCLAQNTESSARRHREKPVSTKEYSKNLREKRKANGQCIWCGKPLSKNSKCFCPDCRIKNQRKNEKRKSGIDRTERPIYGLCYRCGKAPIIEGKKLCKDCYNSSLKSLEIGAKSEATIQRREYIHKQNNLIFQKRSCI